MKYKKIPVQAITLFQNKVLSHYRRNKRDLPWRRTPDPYRILVSEIMLQQTQVDRVILKYTAFIRAFPDVRSLARASLRKLLVAWQGLGYNRRALMLQRSARIILEKYDGSVPDDPEELVLLPGIGMATAAAVLAYAFNKPMVYIETNIRTVFIHEFFYNKKTVHDKELVPLVEKTLFRKEPRTWYNALMDYGVMLKKKFKNPSRRSVHHSRQSKFKDSDREIRGMIIRLLSVHNSLSLNRLQILSKVNKNRLVCIADQLLREGLIKKISGKFTI